MKIYPAVVLAAATAVALAADFYEDRLRAGEAELAAGRPAEAADDLRIAAFGLLDRPPLLCQALGNLALAQQAAGRRAEADGTIERYAQTAGRAPECREASFSAEKRRELRALAQRALPGRASNDLFEPARQASSGAAPPRRAPEVTAAPRPTASTAAAAPTPAAVAAAPPAPTRVPAASNAPSAQPAAPRVSEPPIPAASDLDREPQIRSAARAVPPPGTREGGGVVLVRVLVSETGAPARVEIARGIGPDLDAAALEAVRRWRFEPARKDGAPVAAWMNVAVPFEPARR